MSAYATTSNEGEMHYVQVFQAQPLDQAIRITETQCILRALKDSAGHKAKAAKLLGISRSRLYRRMEALGIK